MPGTYRVQVTIPKLTAIPADAITNTFHFEGTGTDEADAAAAATRVAAFYNEIASGTPVGLWLAPSLNGAGARIKVYSLGDPEPRSPVYDAAHAITVPSGGTDVPLPAEVAVCLSYQGVPESGIPQARRRGRLFIGPLSSLAAERVSHEARPKATMLNNMATSADELAAKNSDSLFWCVHSSLPSVPGGGNFNARVVGGWLDNAFDTQRRRGVKATSRVLWS